jgi:GNAT superfamily N-acetyltransferase
VPELGVTQAGDDKKELSVERITSTKDVDWHAVSRMFAEVGWGDRDPGHIRTAFEKSSHVVFVYEHGELVGFGRTMDDGRYYAMLVDVVVKPSAQGRGIGREIVTWLRQQLDGYKFVTLTAAVGKDEFYLRLGWQRQRSAMIWPMSDQQRDAHALASSD